MIPVGQLMALGSQFSSGSGGGESGSALSSLTGGEESAATIGPSNATSEGFFSKGDVTLNQGTDFFTMLLLVGGLLIFMWVIK